MLRAGDKGEQVRELQHRLYQLEWLPEVTTGVYDATTQEAVQGFQVKRGLKGTGVLDRTISGGVTLDDVVFHVSMEDLPFGGVGPSGMGSYHGHDGFKTFSHAKAVYKQSKLDVAGLAGMKPPYGAKLRRTVAKQIGAREPSA